jgi:hypothetical protein
VGINEENDDCLIATNGQGAMTQMPDNQFNSLDYSDPMVCRVINVGGSVSIVAVYAGLTLAGSAHSKALSGSIGHSGKQSGRFSVREFL